MSPFRVFGPNTILLRVKFDAKIKHHFWLPLLLLLLLLLLPVKQLVLTP
jgi:hypothetical protein